MCDCLTRFQRDKQSNLSLPLDPVSELCSPSPELVIEYQQIAGQWNVYVQKFLLGVINHTNSPSVRRTPSVMNSIKKKRGRRPKMTETQKVIVINSIRQNLSAKEIAKLASVTTRAVHDMKYQIARSGLLNVARSHPASNGQ